MISKKWLLGLGLGLSVSAHAQTVIEHEMGSTQHRTSRPNVLWFWNTHSLMHWHLSRWHLWELPMIKIANVLSLN